MKFSIKTSDNRKRKVYLMLTDITLHTTAVIDDIIEDDANIYIMLGDKKYRIVEEV